MLDRDLRWIVKPGRFMAVIHHDGLSAWLDLERRHPVSWRLGVAALVAGGAILLLIEAGTLPRPPRGVLRSTIAALVLLALVVGRRALWNDAERRPRTLWRIAVFGLLLMWLHIAAQAVGLELHPGALIDGDSRSVLRFTLTMSVLVTVSVLIAARWLDRRPLTQLGIVPGPGFWRDLFFGLGLGALLMTVIFCAELVLGWVRVVGVARHRPPGEPFASGLLRMSAAFLAVGFYEELLSRGYLLRTLAQGVAGRRVSPPQALMLAALVSSALFGLGHAGNPDATLVSTFNVAIAGIVLSLPYILTGRLATSIGLHATWNFFQAVVYGFPASGISSPTAVMVLEQSGPPTWTGGEFGPEAGWLGLLGELAIGAFIVWRERRRRGALTFCAALVDGGR
jgi:hypothetical protein